MAEKRVAPCGSWKSPIGADLIVSGVLRLDSVELDGEDTYWIEGRPEEGGRCVVVRCTPGGNRRDITPPGFNARSRVHEYGGGAYTAHNGVVFFSNFDDNRLYRQDPGDEPVSIAPGGDLRYADLQADPARDRLICVREDHGNTGAEAVNTLVAIPMSGQGDQRILASGNDFYSSPALSPDGSTLAWLTWSHPNMPWDGCELWIGSFSDNGGIADARRVAGGPAESIFQPQWSPDGALYFVSDRSGWWNLYRHRGGSDEPVAQMEAELGLPQWVFRMSTYAFRSPNQIVCAYLKDGFSHLATIDTATGALRDLDMPYTAVSFVRAAVDRAVVVAGSPTQVPAVVALDPETGEANVLRRSSDIEVDPGYISRPQPVEFPTEGGLTAHAFYYSPQNADFEAPPDERPPLIVDVHGGPTGAARSDLSLDTQFWTSRGFALAAVNYGGSTGYGRAYRERLNGRWGVVDVDDAVNLARYLAEEGKVDPDRLIIVGGSAGGYTTLSTLTFRNVFRTGASHFGIGDLVPFVYDTHKFESRYLFTLIGPYPEREDLYQERSALNYRDRLSVPVILFQGLDDKVVPPNQAEMMAEALDRKGIPYAYVAFAGEGHGFRNAENIKRALEGELYFYARILRFELPEPVEPVEIHHLHQLAGSA